MQADNSNVKQFVTFRLSEDLFGIEVTRTREILGATQVTRVPQTPGYMLGVINLRSQVVPVIDMRMRLEVPVEEDTRDTCILVVEVEVEGETVVIGLKADAVCEVLDLPPERIEPPPRLGTRLRTEFIQGMGQVGEAFLILLDINRVFNSDELAMVQELGEFDVPSDEGETQVAMV